MTLAHARKLCRKWQRRLKLSDHTIELRYPVPSDDFDAENLAARCTWTPQYTWARILVTKNVTEHDIVHELLHVRLEGHTSLETADAKRRRADHLYERAINALAEALTGKPE